VAPREVAEHRPRLLVVAVAGPGIAREDGNGRDVTHRGQAGHEDLAGVPARVEEVVLVLLAGRDVGPGRGRRIDCRIRTTSRRIAGGGENDGSQQAAARDQAKVWSHD